VTVPAVVGVQPVDNDPIEGGLRPRRVHARPALLVARHAIMTTPWATLTAGCGAGTAALALLAYFAGTSHTPLDQTTVRLTLLPAAAALTFVPHPPLRPLAQTSPLPTSILAVTQVVLAVPVLVVTSWVQLVIMAHTHPANARHHLPATYPLIAQLVGWAAIALAAAACCDRTRYADLTGAIAAPITFAVIAFAWFTPGVKDLLVTGPATPRTATIAWYSIAAASLVITAAALRDTWHRYTRPWYW
jgi:hypothetical protein